MLHENIFIGIFLNNQNYIYEGIKNILNPGNTYHLSVQNLMISVFTNFEGKNTQNHNGFEVSQQYL